jgi:hypothetical protein
MSPVKHPYLVTPEHFARARTELAERRVRISVKHQHEFNQLDSELDALNAAEELVKKLAASSPSDVAEQGPAPTSAPRPPRQINRRLTLDRPARARDAPAHRPPRQLNRPSGKTSGQIPQRWTQAEEGRVLSADPGDDALLSIELDRSVAAIRKQRTLARRRQEESITLDSESYHQEESSSETAENFEAREPEPAVAVEYQDQEPTKEQEPAKEQPAGAPSAAHHPALDRYRSWGR